MSLYIIIHSILVSVYRCWKPDHSSRQNLLDLWNLLDVFKYFSHTFDGWNCLDELEDFGHVSTQSFKLKLHVV